MDVRHTASCKAFNTEKMNKVNLFETDRMFCDLYCFEPGQQQKVHAHAGADKVYYVLEGLRHLSHRRRERRTPGKQHRHSAFGGGARGHQHKR